MKKLLCNDCAGKEGPDYQEQDNVKIVCLGYCYKCGCGVYEVQKLGPGVSNRESLEK